MPETSSGAPPPFLLALDLAGRPCLVVGAGPVATRKAASLLECGAHVTVVAPDISPAMVSLAARHPAPELVIEQRPYRSGEVAGYRIAVTATGVQDVDMSVYLDGEACGTLVNAADDPDACAFLVPAMWRSGDVSVAVSTGGVSPFVAGWVRRRIAAALGSEIAELARLVGEGRTAIRAAGVATEGLDWGELVDGRVWPLLEAGDSAGARVEVARFVAEAGAGPEG